MSPQGARDIAELLSLLKDLLSQRPNEWLPVYAAIGGAFVGAVSSFFPIIIVEVFKNRKESRQIEKSMIVEISALLEVIEAREYLDEFKKIIEKIKSDPEIESFSLTIDVPTHYSRIYQENCNRIGIIDSNKAAKIVRFHQLIDAVVQDVKPGGVLSNGAEVDFFVSTARILEQALEIGNELRDMPRTENEIRSF